MQKRNYMCVVENKRKKKKTKNGKSTKNLNFIKLFFGVSCLFG